MNIGSLFIELGVKGSSEAVRGIGSLGKGLRDVSLIANQSIQFMSKLYGATKDVVTENSKLGNALLISSKNLDVSTDSLQRWEYAAELTGAKSGEMTSAFKALQSSLLNIRDNDVPQYFQYLFQQMGSVDKAFDSSRFLSGDLEYAMASIRKLAKNGEYDLARLNAALSSLGFSEGVSSFLKLSDVDLSKISKSLIISNKSVNDLDKMHQGLVEIGQISKVAFADIATVFDRPLINEIKGLVKELASLAKELTILMKEYNVVGKVKDATQFAAKTVVGITQSSKGIHSSKEPVVDSFGNLSGSSISSLRAFMESKRAQPMAVSVTNNITTDTSDPLAVGDAAAKGSSNGLQEAFDSAYMQIGGQ